jgi:hypothetical protein
MVETVTVTVNLKMGGSGGTMVEAGRGGDLDPIIVNRKISKLFF